MSDNPIRCGGEQCLLKETCQRYLLIKRHPEEQVLFYAKAEYEIKKGCPNYKPDIIRGVM